MKGLDRRRVEIYLATLCYVISNIVDIEEAIYISMRSQIED